MGVQSELTSLGLIRHETPLSGASGGALAAITTALNLDPGMGVQACSVISETFRRGGTLREALDPVMHALVPDDAIQMLADRTSTGGRVTVAYMQVYPSVAPQHVTSFDDRDDLLDCLRASCCVPLYFNGILPVSVRGGYAVDGIFANLMNRRFGCPATGAGLDLVSCPFPAHHIGLQVIPNQTMLLTPSTLSPLLCASDWMGAGAGGLSDAFINALSPINPPPHPTSTSKAGLVLPLSPPPFELDALLAAAACTLTPFERFFLGLRPPTVGIENKLERFCATNAVAFERCGLISRWDTDTDTDSDTRFRLGFGRVRSQLVYSALFHQGALVARVACAEAQP